MRSGWTAGLAALEGGRNKAVHAIGRFGKQLGGGMHRVNFMQTAVVRDPDSFDAATRNGYVSGRDFELNFKDRMVQVTGSFVGSIVDGLAGPDGAGGDPAPVCDTGSRFEIENTPGDWPWALATRHQGDQLDLNDFGYINNASHYAVQGWVTRQFNADDEKSAAHCWMARRTAPPGWAARRTRARTCGQARR